MERRHWPDFLERAFQHALTVGERAGVVTADQINKALPDNVEITARQIEELLAALSDNGIHLIEGSDEQEGP